MACSLTAGGKCSLTGAKCDNCINNITVYTKRLYRAVLQRNCKHLGAHTGMKDCGGCPDPIPEPEFECKLKGRAVSAKHCLSCRAKE